MALFEKALEASVMSTHLLIRANVSKSILLQAYEIAKRFEARYSAYKEDSFLSQINAHAGTKALLCTPEDIALFETSLQASRETEGAFDISIGALSHGAYHFGFSNQTLASKESIKRQKKLVNYQDIILNNQEIFLAKKGMRLDIGGIGKGYVCKLIAHFLQKSGATKILVDVGGEIFTFGKSYNIALKNPFAQGSIATIKTSKSPLSISTSGDYERFIDSKNHHILDKSSGSSSTYYSSMSIIQNGWNIAFLDAYATALFNQNPGKLRIMAKKLQLSVIAVHKKREIALHDIPSLEIKGVEFYGNI